MGQAARRLVELLVGQIPQLSLEGDPFDQRLGQAGRQMGVDRLFQRQAGQLFLGLAEPVTLQIGQKIDFDRFAMLPIG